MMEVNLDDIESIEASISDLLSKMTLEEKVNQLVMCESQKLIENNRFSKELADKYLTYKTVGTVTTPNLSPEHIVRFINDFQAYITSEARIQIPALMVAECLHGVMAENGTIFPHSIAMASSFNKELVEKTASIIGLETSMIGAKQGLAPDLDLAREPRWGRVEETYGEDPYLCERLGVAYIKGLQGSSDGFLEKGKIAATLKHYAAHGSPEGGVNLSPVPVGERQLRELYLPPFKACIKEAKAMSVMNAYSEVDGIPCASSKYLLTDILRNEWKFKGYIIADFESIAMLKYFQKTAGTYKEAARQAFSAGLDLEAPAGLCYIKNLIELVEEGSISQEQVDCSVRRVLRTKFKVGLFNEDKVDLNHIKDHYNSQDHKQVAREVANESIVLLKNKDSLLPLSKSINKIAVIGPNGDTPQMGDYTIFKDGILSPYEGLKEAFGCDKVSFEQGCDLIGASKEGIGKAVKLAQESEVAIVCVGGTSMVNCGVGWETNSEFDGFAFKNKYATCGEGFDRHNLSLPGFQEELVKAVLETGTPTILILINGRPYSIPWIAEKTAGLIEMWYAGEEGGRALADIISGQVNPSGKLPISIPKHVGQIPIYYNHKPSARGFYGNPGSLEKPGRDYVFMDTKPLYPFGYGLSYTEFEYSNLMVQEEEVLLKEGEFKPIQVSVSVKNIGNLSGKEAVLLYVNDVISSVSTPVKSLRGFHKIQLQPGEAKTISFELSFEDLALYDACMTKRVEPGEFEVMIGDICKTFTILQA